MSWIVAASVTAALLLDGDEVAANKAPV